MPEKPAKIARRRSKKPQVVAQAEREVEHDDIATRAYFIYLDEGRSELDNWLRAERELTTA